ncbi:MAG: ParA family protein [Bacteroidota bacterium]
MHNPSSSAIVIAVINYKGGVGKTTTAVSIASALSLRYRTLVVDLDSQGSAIFSLGQRPATDGHTLASVLTDTTPIHRIVKSTAMEGLDIAGGTPDLEDAQIQMAYQSHQHHRLKFALDSLRDQYDFIILDCPPAFGLLARNAMIAAHHYLVPLTPHYLALRGLVGLQKAIKRLKASQSDVATMMGIVLTMVDYRTRITRDVIHVMREKYGNTVFETEIPMNVRLAEAPGTGQTIYDFASDSKGARQYWNLSKEVVYRSGILQKKNPVGWTPMAVTSGDGSSSDVQMSA